MRRGLIRPIIPIILLGIPSVFAQSQYREISITELRDKIHGGWAGQMIGVSYGAPTEFRYLQKIIPEDKIPSWSPDRISNSIHQDDLYVDMTFAKVLDDKGLNATPEDFGAMFQAAQYHLWHANLAARRALRRGVSATESGTPRFNAHANDIDFQIESDFVGLMCPGLPQAANDLCYRAGRVMNAGDGILGGIFVSGMYAAAFFESDPRKVVEAGHKCLPRDSPYAKLISDVLEWSKELPDDWIDVWHRLEDKWNRRDPCPAGALRPFNIDAKLNGAYIVLGLLYGNRDFAGTLKISTRAGQDSDCNPSSACGILGVMIGYGEIPEKWRDGIAEIADQKFDYTDYSLNTIVESTLKRASALIEKTGGRSEGNRLIVKTQAPMPAKVVLWDDYGSPAERIQWSDPRWNWTGSWHSDVGLRGANLRITDQKGAEASVTFRGTGAILVGPFLPTGGRADIYLDGASVRTIDVYPDEKRRKRREAIWHTFGLEDREHTLRVMVRGEPFAGSEGSEIAIEDLVVFR